MKLSLAAGHNMLRGFGAGRTVPLAIIAIYFLVALIGPSLVGYNPMAVDTKNRLLPPMSQTTNGEIAVFGTDQLGRDILAQVIAGTQISIGISIATLVLAGFVGMSLGILSAYFGGWLDTLLMRLADIQLAFPAILFAIFIASIFGPGLLNVILVLAVANWVVFARVARGQTLSTLRRDYVVATRALAASHLHVIWHCILPACFAPIAVIATVELGAVVVAEASLSFLGLGAPAGQPSWGLIIAGGRNYLSNAWWIATIPGIVLGILVISVGLVGDALRDHFDPNLRGR